MLFKFRTRMTNVKSNFKSIYDHEDISCDLCDKWFSQTDSHLLDCETIPSKCPSLARNFDAEYEDIFGSFEKQLNIVNIFKEVFEANFLLDEQQLSSSVN